MPFTFSHPAIVLPFIKKSNKVVSATGLVIGSIAPDFEAFINLSDHKLYSHTWPGVFWYDLPLAIILSFIFHNIVRDPLIYNLPTFLKNRFIAFTGFKWTAHFKRHFAVIISSMLIGIVSHLLWDAFTHLNLSNPNAIDSQIYIGRFRLFKLLQYSNSLLGLLLIAWFIFRMPAMEAPAPLKQTASQKMIFVIHRPKRKSSSAQYWAIVYVVAAIVIAIAKWVMGDTNIILFIDIVILGGLLGLIFAPLALRVTGFSSYL